MIVRDAGDRWQIVLQTDHADLSGQLARAWGVHDSLLVAARRHDDGWAVWERSPSADPESGKPRNFLDVRIPVHLHFYRAGIAAITEEDPYAGLLVSMHGAGIYTGRYGTDPSLRLSGVDGDTRSLVEEFVAEQEADHPRRAAEVGVSDDERWESYKLLQIFDRLSLYFCMRDVEAGESAELADYTLEPVAPWHVRMMPCPFGESPARFTLLRRMLPKREWHDGDFRREFFAAEPERLEITIES